MGMARTFQIVRLFHGLTVIENVLLGFHPKFPDGLTRSLLSLVSLGALERRARERAMELLQYVGLGSRADDRIGHLTLGQLRLVDIARALASDPLLLMMDEPAAGLNNAETDNLGEMVVRLKSRGTQHAARRARYRLHHERLRQDRRHGPRYQDRGRHARPRAQRRTGNRRLYRPEGEPCCELRTCTPATTARRRCIPYRSRSSAERLFRLSAPTARASRLLINSISRLVTVSSGAIWLEDRNIVSLKAAEVVEHGIVQVPEGRQLFAPLTVEENLRLGFHRLAKKPNAAANFKQRLDYVLSLFPIMRERASQRAGTMSGGEQQMVAVSRALMADPKVLMLDEPSLGLAPMIVDQIFEILAMLRKDGLTILLVEQHADEALQLADYGYIMSVGKVRAEGPGNTLRKDPALHHSYLGRPTKATA